jgi:hypothetical protein
MNPDQRWTQTALSDLRSRLDEGEQIEGVAAGLGRSVADVQAMMTRLRLRTKVA